MKRIATYLLTAVLLAGFTTGALANKKKDELTVSVKEAKTTLLAKDEGFKKILDEAAGYALFPSVAKGGLMYEASVGGQEFKYEDY